MKMLKEHLLQILDNYLKDASKNFGESETFKVITRYMPQEITEIVKDKYRYRIIGSCGKGKWAKYPWIAIIDRTITGKPQTGFYPMFLFREDMSGLYLSLNQGVARIRSIYKRRAKIVLESFATSYRSLIDKNFVGNFIHASIDLKVTNKNSLASYYETGNIIAKYYSKESVYEITETEIEDDLNQMLFLYSLLVEHYLYSEQSMLDLIEDDETEYQDNLIAIKHHKSIEKNPELARKVKEIHGYTCEVCGFNFEKTYSEIGKNYIEAHCLIPFPDLKGKESSLDLLNDFVVLCSNCHSMIHKFKKPWDIKAFKEYLKK
jgi:5-methylcytosine-specific restriction protein A